MRQWTETVNWLFPHIIHRVPVHFISFEQFTDNLLMALFTSQQEAVQATLEEGWQTYGITKYKLHTTHCKGDKADIQ